MSYRAAIIKATGVDIAEAAVIEEIMRVDRPTLEALTSREFNRLARVSKQAIDELRVEDPEVAAFYEGLARS
jgi:hypothetical protein